MARCIEAKISRQRQRLLVNIKQEPLEYHPSFQCSSCPESFKDANKLAEHQEIHLGNYFESQIEQSEVCILLLTFAFFISGVSLFSYDRGMGRGFNISLKKKNMYKITGITMATPVILKYCMKGISTKVNVN